MHAIVIIGVAGAAAAAPASNNAPSLGPSAVVAAVEACRPIADGAARLACYDRAVAALATARSRGDIRVVDRGELRQVRRSLFGFTVPKLPFFGGSGGDRGEAEQKTLAAKLTSFRAIGEGFFRFSIDEPASSWESTEGSFLGDPRPGAAVKIERGAMSSYFAQIGKAQWVRVRRVR